MYSAINLFKILRIGSTQSLLDPLKMMSLQDDAKDRRITAEIMKRHLYESVVTAKRPRHLSVRTDRGGFYGSSWSLAGESDVSLPCGLMTQSMPVTPSHGSADISPARTPTGTNGGRSRLSYFRLHSRRGTTSGACSSHLAENGYLEEEEESCMGLISIFNPQPRYVAVQRSHSGRNSTQADDGKASTPLANNGIPP